MFAWVRNSRVRTTAPQRGRKGASSLAQRWLPLRCPGAGYFPGTEAEAGAPCVGGRWSLGPTAPTWRDVAATCRRSLAHGSVPGPVYAGTQAARGLPFMGGRWSLGPTSPRWGNSAGVASCRRSTPAHDGPGLVFAETQAARGVPFMAGRWSLCTDSTMVRLQWRRGRHSPKVSPARMCPGPVCAGIQAVGGGAVGWWSVVPWTGEHQRGGAAEGSSLAEGLSRTCYSCAGLCRVGCRQRGGCRTWVIGGASDLQAPRW